MMTPQEMTDAVIAAGFDTPEKLVAILKTFSDQASIKEIDLKLEENAAAQGKLLEPLRADREALEKERAVRFAAINAARV